MPSCSKILPIPTKFMIAHAFSRPDAVLNEATKAVRFQDLLVNVASLDCTVIVPSAAHRREALVIWTRHVRGGTPPEVCTLASYARQIIREHTTDNVRLLNTADASLVLRYAARSTRQRLGSLDFSIERLLRWKAEGITPSDLNEKAEDEFAPGFVRVLDRFARVWSAYELIKGPKGADRVDMMGIAARHVLDTPPHDYSRVVVWGPHMLTQAESALVRALGVHASVAIVWAPSSNAAMVRERTNDIIGWGWDQISDEIANTDGDAVGIANTDDYNMRRASIRVFSENTRIDEARRILYNIKTAISNGNVGARDVCIISAGSSEYRRQLQERATRAGIPVAVDPQRTLHTSGVALALRAACDVVSGGWRRPDLERLLRSGFVVAESVSVGALLRAASAHRIQGGGGSTEWNQTLRHRHDVLRRVLEHDADQDEAGQALSVIEAALRTLGWLRPILVDADVPITGALFSQMLTAFLQRLGIARTATLLESAADAENLPCAEREALVAIEALSERYAVLTQEIGLPTMAVAEHTREWWALVRATSVRTPDVRLDGIPILTPEEARGRTWKLVLSPGFVEGEFPVRDDDPLEAEVLPDNVTRKQRAAFDDILHAITTDGAIVATYPKEVDDAETLPSAFLRGLEPQPSDNAAFILDPYEREAHSGKGLLDLKGRQRAALPEATEEAAKYVSDIVYEPLSASRLDRVAACPYQFYANRILHLNIDTDSEDALSGLERGAMMHDIARRFYERVRGRPIKDVTSLKELLDARVHLEEVRRHEYMALLLDVYVDVSRLYDTDHTYAESERRSILGTPQRPGLLYRWLAHELRQQSNTDLRPALFEFDLDVVVRGEAIRGRVDRVDVAPYQPDTGDNGVVFAVIDYKTTKNSLPSVKSVRGGEATQMPLYLAAVHAAFAERGIEATPTQAIYRTFGRSMKSADEPSDIAVLTSPTSEQLQELFHAIIEHVDDMRASSYPVAPRPNACKRCSYQDVCRVASWGTVQRT